MNEYLLFLASVVVFVIYFYFWGMKAPKPYRNRSCMGKEWKTDFPQISKNKIRLYLECFIDGMAFENSEKLKFRPDDKIIDVYRSIYGGVTPYGDAMELETFSMNIEQYFNVSQQFLMDTWRENMTLGELFKAILAQQNHPADARFAHDG
ncbi:MAG: hypothetical protein N0E58_16780 [Candidatus Thiodiazotropha endolucinida]|uniref:Uncharacterized protein n=1 Tax=Candidatus Thiodiazotropha taylori TaxID=2792791 RepID=A0A9E4NLT2_9GAMM|nr:hypothetical protein [Candidatus Thiodiazotropha taylori]MCW4237904.1 hypothetical protein [Candidatus Thiodiazotropha endolucinida]